jgi:hypothetical protein
MNLMSLIRSIGFLAIGWTVLALGVGASGVWTPASPSVSFFLPKPSLHDAITIGKPAWRSMEQICLVDRVTGKSEPMRLPSEEVWALLTVSPWRDQDGNVEVVGRWARHNDALGERPFFGLGRFRLPDATVVNRIPLDILPNGRPCLLPGRTGEIVFPSGDGQLYRLNLAENSQGNARSGLPSEEGEEGVGTGSARPVSWHCVRPCTGPMYINDPLWSPELRLGHYLLVSLSSQKQLGKKILQVPHKLWWLKMNDRYDEIQAAGPLNGLVAKSSAIESVAQRFPTIAVGADGKLSLLYMTRQPEEKSWRLDSARLERDPKTGRPYLLPNEKARAVFTEGLAADPPLVSADGKCVFARASTGELTTIKLVDDR